MLSNYYVNISQSQQEKEQEYTHTRDGITLQNIKYIILEYYHCLKPYSLDIFTNKTKQIIISKINIENNITRNANRPVIVNSVKCWNCGLEIFVHNLVVMNKYCTRKQRRRYHFKCALSKKLVELIDLNNPMPQIYHKFIAGIII